MARRVLVEQRREERAAELPIRLSRSTSATSPSRDAPSSVAQRCAARRRSCPRRSGPRGRPRTGCAARSTSEPAMSSGFVAAHAFRPLRVGRREDLLGRDVRHVPHPRARLRRAALLREARARQQADREVGPGPAKWSASRSSASSLLATCQICSIRSCHAAAGSGSSSRQTWTMSCHSRSSAFAPARRDTRSRAHRASGTATASTRPTGRRSP